jgi:hypothetical protein
VKLPVAVEMAATPPPSSATGGRGPATTTGGAADGNSRRTIDSSNRSGSGNGNGNSNGGSSGSGSSSQNGDDIGNESSFGGSSYDMNDVNDGDEGLPPEFWQQRISRIKDAELEFSRQKAHEFDQLLLTEQTKRLESEESCLTMKEVCWLYLNIMRWHI